MVGTTAALIGMGIAGAGSSLIGGAMKSKAANKAGELQSAAADKAGALQRPAADEANALIRTGTEQANAGYAPYLDAGRRGLDMLTAGLSQGGEFARNFGASDFQTDPGYGFRQSQGEQALSRTAAARGGTLGGAATKAALRFNSGLASQEYGNAFDRFMTQRNARMQGLGNLAGFGYNATNATGANTINSAAMQGNNITRAAALQGDYWTQGANARAAGIVGSANAWGDALTGTGKAVASSLAYGSPIAEYYAKAEAAKK